MSISKTTNAINQAAATFLQFDETTSPTQWREYRKGFALIEAEGMENGWQILVDATQLSQKLITGLSESHFPHPQQAISHIENLITILTAIAEDLETDSLKPRNFKAEFSAVRVFLNDLDGNNFEEAKVSLTQTPADNKDEEAEFQRIMLEHINAIEQTLLGLPEGKPAIKAMGDIFREFHTLKGETGILGMTALRHFFHNIESALEPVRNQPIAITSGLINALMAATDLSQLLISEGPELEETCIKIQDECIQELSQAIVAAPLCEDEDQGSEEEEADDEFFAAMAESQPVDKGERSSITVKLEKLKGDTFQEKDENGLGSESSNLEVIPIDVERIDKLLGLVASTTAAAGAVGQNPLISKLEDTDVNSDIMALTRATNALQDLAVGLRMMPIQGLFQRMKRVAFDVCQSSGKRAKVVLKGAETQVDRGVIENLTGAMVHLIRNAIDHGIEPPAKRREMGKPEYGRITLQAGREGSDIFIEISDDGQGLDRKLIRQKAIEKGLVSPESIAGNEKMHDLIFTEGLSTAKTITGVSGRGVGMMAVKKAVEALRGKISVNSSPGAGTTIHLTLPLALASIEGLVVRVGRSYYVIPAHAMRECFSAKPEDLNLIKGKDQMVNFRNTLLPIIHLGKLFGITFDTEEPTQGVMVVAEHQKRFAAIHVDEIINSQQIMVRPLEGELAKINSVSGTTALGNHGMALVLEMAVILAEISTTGNNDLGGVNKRDQQIETVDIGSNQVGMVDFTIDHVEKGKQIRSVFAINAFKAREFVPATELTQLPDSPKGFAGMLLLRDRTIPVVKLVDLLGFTPAENSENIIMICEFGSQTIGMLVSAINRVHYISWAEIKPPPDSHGLLNISYVVGIILMDDEPLFVLDFEHIVQDVLRLYQDFGDSLQGVEQRKTGSRILLVEDSAIVRRKISAALKQAGMEVIEAANGREAKDIIIEMVEKVNREGGSIFDHLDLVLSDIEMPELDGYTLTNTIKTHPALMGLPVILQSSLTNETVVQRAKEAHADGVVGKHDPNELALLLRQYL